MLTPCYFAIVSAPRSRWPDRASIARRPAGRSAVHADRLGHIDASWCSSAARRWARAGGGDAHGRGLEHPEHRPDRRRRSTSRRGGWKCATPPTGSRWTSPSTRRSGTSSSASTRPFDGTTAKNDITIAGVADDQVRPDRGRHVGPAERALRAVRGAGRAAAHGDRRADVACVHPAAGVALAEGRGQRRPSRSRRRRG